MEKVVIPYRSRGTALTECTRLAYQSLWIMMICTFVLLFVGDKNATVIKLVSDLGLKSNYSGVSQLCTILSAAQFTLIAILNRLRYVWSQTQLVLSSESIRLPCDCLISAKGRLNRLWSDVSAAAIVGNPPGDAIVLRFGSGGMATLELARIPQEMKEQLLLCAEMRLSDKRRDPSIAAYLDALQMLTDESEGLSFTQLWEMDMNRRFSPTAYVTLEPGQTLGDGRFTIKRQLAFGGLSAIYLARGADEKSVIIKEAAVPNGADPNVVQKSREMLVRETNLLRQIQHPQIVQVIDFFFEHGHSYLVLEYISGENIRQLVSRKGPVNEQTAVNWAAQISSILTYLHQHSPPVVHRDISPDNIVVSEDGRVTLIDFGAANEFLAEATGTIVGKQAYMAPEQFRGHAVPRSDLYSLGATIYFMLTGKDPEPLSEIQLQDNVAVSPALSDLVYELTQLDAETRTADAATVETRLRDLGSTVLIVRNEQAVKQNG